MDTILKTVFSKDNNLKRICISAKAQYLRHIELFNKSENDAKSKAMLFEWDNFREEDLLVIFLQNPGLEHLESNYEGSCIKGFMISTVSRFIEIIIDTDIEFDELLGSLRPTSVFFNYPSDYKELTKTTMKELKQCMNFFESDSFYSKYKYVKALTQKTDNQCNTLAGFLTQTFIEENLYFFIERSETKKKQSTVICRNKYTNDNKHIPPSVDGKNIRSLNDRKLDLLTVRTCNAHSFKALQAS